MSYPRHSVNTLLIVKNHIVRKQTQWLILNELETAGFRIDTANRLFFNECFYREFYKHLESKSFYSNICKTYSLGDVIIVLLSGNDVINMVRDFIGPTNPADAKSPQIRFNYGETTSLNAVHASANYEDYIKEIELIKLYESKL